MFFDMVSSLMSRIGPDQDYLLVDEYRAEALWQIAIDEKTLVIVELEDDRRMLVMSADIGALPAEKRGEFYETMAQPDLAVRDPTGSARLGFDGTSDKLWLVQDIAAPALTFDRFKTEILAFTKRIRGWRALVETICAVPGESGDEMLRTLSTDGFIRS